MSMPKDEASLDDALYSNIDHLLNDDVLTAVAAGGVRGQHAAWDYCGWVWKDDEGWHETVMRYGQHLDTFHGDSAKSVIEQTLEAYGTP